MKITRELLRAWRACYKDERIAELVPIDGLTPLELIGLDIPEEDRLWVLLRDAVIPARNLRLLACKWASDTCRKAGWADERSINAINVAARFADGNATRAELDAANAVAWLAARDAARGITGEAPAVAAAWATSASAWIAAKAGANALSGEQDNWGTQIEDVKAELRKVSNESGTLSGAEG